MKKTYTQPLVEIIELAVENGYQASATPTTTPSSDDSGIGAEGMGIIEW
ncbi:MAG: hypothetical protein IKA60_02695 [Rikenellaceae bacterium]|nr:hypothetical protein [Rikenellaceae bacterium]MBR2443143.1 hypothetical protein [Rikenellaceae bacterium]